MDLLQVKDNGIYCLPTSSLMKLQEYEPSLRIERKDDTMQTEYKEVSFLLDEGMLIIGTIRIINDVSRVIDFPELSFYRNAVYTFLEASFPDDIEAERQFLYKCPEFLYKKLEDKIILHGR